MMNELEMGLIAIVAIVMGTTLVEAIKFTAIKLAEAYNYRTGFKRGFEAGLIKGKVAFDMLSKDERGYLNACVFIKQKIEENTH